MESWGLRCGPMQDPSVNSVELVDLRDSCNDLLSLNFIELKLYIFIDGYELRNVYASLS